MTTKTWWWLSFATDTEFLGVAIVEADAENIIDAAIQAIKLGCVPGKNAEVAGTPANDGVLIPDEYKNRLLTYDELQAADQAICDLNSIKSETVIQ